MFLKRIRGSRRVGSLKIILNLPCPADLTVFWTLGRVLGALYLGQVLSGLALAFHYIPIRGVAYDVRMDLAYTTEGGWFLRRSHANGARLFMGAMYVHLARGIYFMSYIRNTGAWYSGRALMSMTIRIRFLGYVLP